LITEQTQHHSRHPNNSDVVSAGLVELCEINKTLLASKCAWNQESEVHWNKFTYPGEISLC